MKPHPIHRQPSEPAGGRSERTGLANAGSFQAWGRSRVFTPDCEVGNAVPTLFLHNPSPTLKPFLREPRSSENLPQAPCGSDPQNLICSLIGKEWAPTRLTQLAAPEKPETDILLPVLVQCWAGRRRHRATPAPRAELRRSGRQALEIITSPKTVPRTSFTSLGLSTKLPSHPKFLIPSKGAGRR